MSRLPDMSADAFGDRYAIERTSTRLPEFAPLHGYAPYDEPVRPKN